MNYGWLDMEDVEIDLVFAFASPLKNAIWQKWSGIKLTREHWSMTSQSKERNLIGYWLILASKPGRCKNQVLLKADGRES